MRGRRAAPFTALAAAALLLTACARDHDGSATRTVTVERTTTVEKPAVAAEAAPTARPASGFDAQDIYHRVAPGVVTVISTGLGSAGDEGIGSGFVVSDSGEIATNAHVVTSGEGSAIKPAGNVYVSFQDRDQVPARIVGFDPFADVALLKIDPAGLHLRPVRLGTAAELAVGAPVAAIGSPFGEERSLSVGVISATGRSIQSLTGFATPGAIQTDAAINKGNSGGPLLDSHGRVLGINSQIETDNGSGSGVGFAVPVDVVRRSLGQLRRSGKPSYAYMGVSTAPVYPQLSEHFGLGTRTGAWVQEVTTGGPAAAAGVHAGAGQERYQARDYIPGGDVIVAVDGQVVRDENDLASIVAGLDPAATTKVVLVRDGKRSTLDVKLTERPLNAPR